MGDDAATAVLQAEYEMFAAVVSEVFLGVLAEYEPEPWYDTAVDRLSRGAAPKLWASLTAAHAAGLRGDPRAPAQAEAIDVLCVRGRKAAGPYDFPNELRGAGRGAGRCGDGPHAYGGMASTPLRMKS